MLENTTSSLPKSHLWENVRNTFYVIGMLLLFLFALDLMVASLQHMGKNVVETIIMATSNPFTGLFIGLLVTAMIQSSSATTSIVVALVASGSITLESAVPIIMGANVGTTITSTIVSLGFINKKKEFRRAAAPMPELSRAGVNGLPPRVSSVTISGVDADVNRPREYSRIRNGWNLPPRVVR